MPITINGDGLIEVGGTSTTQGRVRLAEDSDNGTNYIELTAPASVTSNRTVTFPDSTGTVVIAGGAQTVEFAAGSASTPSVTFTGDTNTGIYSPGADRIGFTEGGTQVGEFDASGNFLFNSGYGSVARAFGCRAWVNFNGTGGAISGSGNVSSVTDNAGLGSYTVNFTNAMPDANYVVNVTARGQNSTDNNSTIGGSGATTTSTANVFTKNGSNALVDSPVVNVAIFR
jgi:hypothetical protein